MLNIALKAGLPLIRVTTTDIIHTDVVLDSVYPCKKWVELTIKDVMNLANKTFMPKVVYFYIIVHQEEDLVDLYQLYSPLSTNGKTLVVVNGGDNSCYYNAGELLPTKDCIATYLEDSITEEALESVTEMMVGLTLKDIEEICKIAMAQFSELSVKTIAIVKRGYSALPKGVFQVAVSEDEIFVPTQQFWDIAPDLELFKKDKIPANLVPRGYLLTGPAGTGKTMTAKALSVALSLPLYRIDIGSVLNKYVGKSEENLGIALDAVERLAPCVILLDEVEKIFGTEDESGISTRLLSSLLWWLQEHKARILTIMTTNDVGKLPKELYRPGRIDATIELNGLEKDGVTEFMKAVYNTVALKNIPYPEKEFKAILKDKEFPLPQAIATKLVHSLVKKQYLD